MALPFIAFSNSFAANLFVPDQHATIQGALNASFPRDVIWVKPGVYQESLNFGGKDVAVRSLEGAKTTVLNPNFQRGAYIGPAGEISGLTISNAHSAVECFGSGSIIRSNIFIKNYQSNWGAGVGGNGASPRIEQNTFIQNFADQQILSGVIVFANSSSPQIINNLFVSNTCAAISLVLPSDLNVLILNNTFIANQKAVYHRSWSQITYRNNILFGNDVGLMWENWQTAPVWHNNLVYGNNRDYEGPVTGNNNISADPMFYDASRGDYRLTRNSPAVDAGAQGPTVDLTGRPRPVDGNLDGSAVADLGALEYVPGPPQAPTILSIVSSPTGIDLAWRREPETQTYILSRATTSGGPYSEIGRTPLLNFSDTNAQPEQEYFYVVSGLNDIGAGPNSDEARERAGNLPPISLPDTFIIPEDGVSILNPLSNDSDPNGNPVAISYVIGIGGSVTNNAINYTPPSNFSGINTLFYVITDGRFKFATNEITVHVLPVNDPPWGMQAYHNAEVGGATDIRLSAYDIDSSEFTYEIVREPEFGRIDSFSSNGRLRYLAGRHTSPFDSFSFRVFDGVDYSVPAEIQLQRIAPRDLDQDGLPDSWETLHDLNNPAADRDLDGSINADEYLAYTDPNDPDSVLKLQSITGANGMIRLQWQGVGGIRYRIQAASDPAGPFTDLVRPLSEELIRESDGVPGVVEHERPAPAALQFYRIKVVP